jgi:hypothetical protein
METQKNSSRLQTGKQRKSPRAESGSGPTNWRNVAAKHREVLTILLDPPGNEPDVTQIEKIRQCEYRIFFARGLKRDFALFSWTRNFSEARKKNCKNALALGILCDRLATVWGSHCFEFVEVERLPQWGEPRIRLGRSG